MKIQNNIQSILIDNPKIPVVTFHHTDDVQRVLDCLVEQEIHCVEITLRTDAALESIELCKKNAPVGFSVGVGTIINEEQVSICKNLEVDFMVSPGSPNALIQVMKASGIAFLPGVMTPSEIINASMGACQYLKLFPFNLAGGLKAIKTYGNVFPSIKFCPTGGVNAENYQQLLELNNVVAVGGSWLI